MNFHQLIRERQSVRNFKPQLVPDVLIKQVVEAGSLAPSACNNQPWVFIVVTDKAILNQIHQSYPREWFDKTAQIIAVCGDHNQSWKRSYDQKDHCDIDVAIAVDHMTLMAAELGLGTCWVCHFNPELVKEALNLPDDIEPIALIPIGYPIDDNVLPKHRKSLDEVMLLNRYQQPE